MLFLLRKIRRKLMAENKITTYLLYAIGEIFLVVIGILIAVNLDNWNSERKTLESAEVHLNLLEQDLQKDLVQLNEMKAMAQRNVAYANSLLNQFKTLSKVDSNTTKYLATLILEYNFTPSKIGYNALDNSGEISALDNRLQQLIRTYYSALDNVAARDFISNSFIRDKFEILVFSRPDIYNKANTWDLVNEIYKDDPREAIPLNVTTFLQDKTLENHIIARWYQSKTQIETYDLGIKALHDVLNEIGNH